MRSLRCASSPPRTRCAGLRRGPQNGAWASSCLCASFRAFRFARPYLGGQQSHFSPLTAPAAVGEGAGFPIPHRTINSKRQREATALLSWRPLHNRPAGVVWQMPGFVGNPATDILSDINPSTTLFPNLGSLGVKPLSVFLVTFCTSKKLPHGVWAHSPLRQGCRAGT